MEAHRNILASLRAGALHELTQHILPYWAARMVDHEQGGFLGRIDGHDRVHPEAPKGAVLNARILWTFAAVARVLDDDAVRRLADRAYRYLLNRFWDPEHGGVYWTLQADGHPLDANKQTYAQAFAIYALAEYHRLTGDAEAKARAIRLFDLIEQHTVDAVHDGYVEVFDRAWHVLEGVPLSEKDLAAPKSMNTHLHVLEAYTNLLRIWPAATLRERLRGLLQRFLDTIVDPQTHHLRLFFKDDWMPVSDTISFGHDIEASWLLVEAAGVLGDPDLLAATRAVALRIADATLSDGIDADGGVLNEASPAGVFDDDKHWWPSAEAVVGLLDAYQLSGEARYVEAAAATWAFIQRVLVDREGGEWFFRVSRDGVPYRKEDKAGLWKCPYHNSRACLEIMARVDQIAAGLPVSSSINEIDTP